MKEIYKVCIEKIDNAKEDKFIWDILFLNNVDTEDFESIAKMIFTTGYLSIEHKYYDYAKEEYKKRQKSLEGKVGYAGFYISDFLLSGGYDYAIIKTVEGSYKIWVAQEFIYENTKDYLGDRVNEML